MKQVLLIGGSQSVIFPFGSELDTITSRDPLPIKVYKYLKNEDIESLLSDVLPNKESIDSIDWIILFKDAGVKSNDVIDFCKETNCNLLILQNEIIDINGPYNFKIIHNSNLLFQDPICDIIISDRKNKEANNQ